MWLPKKLTLVNFISHLKTEFEFKQNATTMIQGVNLDDDCQESNGSGKSGIIEGTVFGITGDSFRKVRAVDLIYNGADESLVSIELFNTISNKTLTIIRNIKKRGSSEVKVFIDNIEQVKSSVNEYNKFILELLDISKEDLMNYFVVSKEKYQSFLLTTDSKKKEIISRFSNSNLIDGVDKLIEKDLKEFETAINNLQNNFSKIEGEVSVYKEQLENQQGKSQFEQNKKNQIDSMVKNISELNNDIKILLKIKKTL
jgi:exonuclease SbcC